ncbi:ninja-family protein AFP2-like [Humulus lupulus]|uniref:ninja-family protein AFP2-like n=1 Tax=Humulus lupulus TaxID=3486 RepID=UPI002B402F08|nr:ninja-family protein AFP2-like [Humulus lupulus]
MAEVERDELELELGLSLGGRRGSFRKFETTTIPLDKESGSSFGGEIDQTTTSRSSTSPAAVSDQKTKREMHAMRRQEAKKKRQEKRNRRLRNSSLVKDHCSNDVSPVMEDQDQDQQRASKREKIQFVSQTLPYHHHQQQQHFTGAVQYPYPSFQFVPFTNGFAYPYMMPWWTPTAGADGKNGVQPMPCRSFGPFYTGQGFGLNVSNGSGSEKNVGKADGEAGKTTSNGCSSSTVLSDSESSLEQNQRNDSKTNDEKANSEASAQNCSETTTVSQPVPEQQPPVADSTPSPNKAAELDRKPPKPPAQNRIGTTWPLQQMPYVSTTGDGPNGKTVTGFLYRYTKSEVNIVCVCHGRTFSPAEFVEHAGGTDISNPLKHITVIPSAF